MELQISLLLVYYEGIVKWKTKCPGQGTGHRTNRAPMPLQAPYPPETPGAQQLQSSPNSVFKEEPVRI